MPRTSNDIIIPDTLYNLVLTPLAKRLGIRYIPQKTSSLIKALFAEIANRAESHVGGLQGLKENIIKIVSVASEYLSIAAQILRPLLQVIPPQYLIVIVAIILGVIVVWPAQFLGLFMYYLAEKWLKVPFIRKSKRDFDVIPKALLNDKYIIEQITISKITISMRQFFKLKTYLQDAYFYEMPTTQKQLFLGIKMYLEKFTDEQLDEALDLISNKQVPQFPIIVNVDELHELTATFYSGKMRVLPPILTRLVAGIKAVFENINSQLGPDAEHPWRAIAKWAFLGWFGFIPQVNK